MFDFRLPIPLWRRFGLQACIFLLFAQLTASHHYPSSVRQGARIEAYIVTDTYGQTVKRCPVSNSSDCEVIVDSSRLSYTYPTAFYPGNVAIERVDGVNRALIVSDRGYAWMYNIALWRCPMDTWAPCSKIVSEPYIHDAPGTEVVMENGDVKGYLVSNFYGQILCEPSSSTDTGYDCSTNVTKYMLRGWGAAVQYSADGSSPESYILSRYKDDGYGVYDCPASLSGCSCRYQCETGGNQLGVNVEYGADGAASAWLVTDGSQHVVRRCPLSGSTCEVLLGTGASTSALDGFSSPHDVQVEPDETGATAAYIVLDRGNSRLMRCPVGSSSCSVLASGFDQPMGLALEWTTFTTTSTTSTTTHTSSTSTTLTFTSSTSTVTTSTTTTTSTSTTTATSTTETSTTSTTSTSTISTSTTTTTISTTTTTSTSTTTITTTISSTTITETATTTTATSTTTTVSTTTTTSTTTSTGTTTTATTTTTTTTVTSTITTTTSSTTYTGTTTTQTKTSTTATSTTTTTTVTSTTTTKTSTTTTVTSTTSTTTVSSTTSTTSTTMTSTTTSTTTTTTTVLSFVAVLFDEAEHYASWSLDDTTIATAQSGQTVTRKTEDGQSVVACGITVSSCGGTKAEDNETSVSVDSPAVVSVPDDLISGLADTTVVLIASLPQNALPSSPTLSSVHLTTTTMKGSKSKDGSGDGEGDGEDDEEEEEDGDDGTPVLQLISEAVSIQLVDHKGSAQSINGLETPIKIGIKLNENSTSLTPAQMANRVTCAYWNTSRLAWATDGVELGGVSNSGTIWCEATHLTIFAVFMDFTFIETLLCANLMIFTPDSMQTLWNSPEWIISAPALLYFALLSIMGVLLAFAVWIDLKRYPLWSDDFFFDETGGVQDDENEAKMAEAQGFGTLRICCGPIGTLWKLARTLCQCRRHMKCVRSSIRRDSQASDTSSETSRSSKVSGKSRRASIVEAVTSPKEALGSAIGSLVAKHCLHANVSFHTLVSGTTLESSGLLAKDDDLAQRNTHWRGGMSRDFIELQRTILRHLPRVMGRVLEDKRYVTMSKLFLFWHPIFDVVCLDVQLPATRKALALSNSILGSLLVSVLFFSTTGNMLSAQSSPLCEMPFEPFRFVFASLLSTIAAALPVFISVKVSQRRFYHAQNYTREGKQAQILQWTCINRLAWLCDVLYAIAVIFFTCSFLANLNVVDHLKWSLIFITIVIRWFLLIPFLTALVEVLAIRVVQTVQPQFLNNTIEVNLQGRGASKFAEESRLNVEKELSERTFEDASDAKTDSVQDVDSHREGGKQAGTASEASTTADQLADAARWERAVTAEEIVEFYIRLPSIMPSFDPITSTVADVTRHAILPLTRARKTLSFRILDISNAEVLEALGEGYTGHFACRFGSEDDSEAAAVAFEEEHWSLESEISGVGRDGELSLTIFKATLDLDVTVGRVSIPGSLLTSGEARTVTLNLEDESQILSAACTLTFQVKEVMPSLESLYNRFHEPFLAGDDRGMPFARWVSKYTKRTPERWLCASSATARFSSLVAATAANTLGRGNYSEILAQLMDTIAQQELLAALQEADKKLYWITCFCEDIPDGDDVTVNIDVDPTRLHSWTAECCEREVPQLVLLDDMDHFSPGFSFMQEVLEAHRFGLAQEMVSPNPETMITFFDEIERIDLGPRTEEIRSMFQHLGKNFLEEQRPAHLDSPEPPIIEESVEEPPNKRHLLAL